MGKSKGLGNLITEAALHALAGERAWNKREFVAWLESLRVSHNATRNFMQRLERIASP